MSLSPGCSELCHHSPASILLWTMDNVQYAIPSWLRYSFFQVTQLSVTPSTNLFLGHVKYNFLGTQLLSTYLWLRRVRVQHLGYVTIIFGYAEYTASGLRHVHTSGLHYLLPTPSTTFGYTEYTAASLRRVQTFGSHYRLPTLSTNCWFTPPRLQACCRFGSRKMQACCILHQNRRCKLAAALAARNVQACCMLSSLRACKLVAWLSQAVGRRGAGWSCAQRSSPASTEVNVTALMDA